MKKKSFENKQERLPYHEEENAETMDITENTNTMHLTSSTTKAMSTGKKKNTMNTGDTKKKGVYGTDGSPISIEKDGDNYVIKGNPNADTKQIFEALLKTPKGVETAIEYTTANYEYRFHLKDVVYDDKNEKVHGQTYEADINDNNCSGNPDLFDHFNVNISLA